MNPDDFKFDMQGFISATLPLLAQNPGSDPEIASSWERLGKALECAKGGKESKAQSQTGPMTDTQRSALALVEDFFGEKGV